MSLEDAACVSSPVEHHGALRSAKTSLEASDRPVTTAFAAGLHWRDELLGGLAGAVASLALALSLGLLAFAPLGPQYAKVGVLAGFASAIYGQLVAALLGGSTHPGSGPRASASLVLAGVVALLAADPALAPGGGHGVEWIVALAGLTVVISGVLQVVFGALGAGLFARYVPYPFVAGFMLGAAVLVIVAQLTALTGVSRAELAAGPAAAMHALQPATLLVGCITAALIWTVAALSKRVPASLGGLVGGTVVFYAVQLAWPDIALGHVVGAMPRSLPLPRAIVPMLDMPWPLVERHLPAIFSGAGVIAVIGTLDTLFAAVAIDHATDGRHDTRREVVAHGFANIASGLCGGVPVLLSRARAMASWDAGGRTRVTAVIAAVLLAVIFIAGRSLVALVPIAVLGGIMVTMGVGLIDTWTHGLVRRLRDAGTRPDQALAWSAATVAVVALTAIFVGFVPAIGVGFLLSGLLFFIGMNRSLVRSVVDATVRPSRRIWGGDNAARVQEARRRIRVVELEGALFFGSAERLAEHVEPLAGVADVVVLDFQRVTAIDATGALLLERLVRRLARKGTQVVLAAVTPEGRHGSTLIAHDAFRDSGRQLWFGDADQAVEWAENRALEKLGKATMREVPLAAFGLLDGLSESELRDVASHFQRRIYPAGDVLFRENDPGDRLCLLARGAVEISIAGAGAHRLRIVTMAEGSLFGEAALLDGRPRSATAQAAEEIVVYELTRDELHEIETRYPPVAIRMMTNLARQLSLRMRETNEIVRQLADSRG